MDLSEKIFFSDLLQRFRKRKRLTQKQLAECIGVRRESVSFWERGQYLPEMVMLHELIHVLDLDEDEKRLLFEAHSGTASMLPLHNLPTERNPYFTGREDILHSLHESLKVGKQVALTQAISGLGGIGKTQVALEYMYRYRESYHDLLWAAADTRETLVASYVELARRLRLREREERDQNKVVGAVRRWLREHKEWLLVLDNIEDLHLVAEFIPLADRLGAVVLTTRRQVTEPIAQAIELGVLPGDDGTLFLLKRVKRLALKGHLDDASSKDVALAQKIVKALGGLPLALDQAGAYILEKGCDLDTYLDLFQQRQSDLLKRRGDIFTEHPQPVTTTFTLTFEQIQQRNEVAIELLKSCAFLAPDAIAEEIFTEGASKLGPILSSLTADPLALHDAFGILQNFSLIRRDSISQTLSIHRLVQAVLKDSLDEQEQQCWVIRNIEAMNVVFPEEEYGTHYSTWDRCKRLVLHALACANDTASQNLLHLDLVSLFYKVARYLYEQAQHPEAETLLMRVLQIREQMLGFDHPDVASTLNNLALVYQRQGRYEQAELIHQRALRIREQDGLEHPYVAQTLYNLANIYWEQGKYKQAESLFQRALHIREQALGPEHPAVALVLNGLGGICRKQNRYEQAELFFQRALLIWEQVLGPESIQVSSALEGLALVYFDLCKYELAEPLLQRALHNREQLLGPEHFAVAEILNSLGILYRMQKKYEQAELIHQQALHIREQQGSEHPYVAQTLYNLANIYWDQGKYEQAESLFQRALYIREQTLGPEHPAVAYPISGLANLYRDQGKYELAGSLYRRALHIRESQLGHDHADTAEIWYEFAVLQHMQGNLADADTLYQCALAVRKQRLGQQHPDTQATLEHYVTLLRETGQSNKAVALEAHFVEETNEEASNELEDA